MVIGLAIFLLRINFVNCYQPHKKMSSQLSAESVHSETEIDMKIR